MKKIISFTLALFVALSIASFEVFADGEALKSPNPVPGRANPTGNILEFDDLTGAAPKGASGYSGVTGELFEADPIEEGDGWTVVFDAMVTKHEPGNNGQLAQFILSPDAGTHQMGYCFSRKHVAFEVSYAGWPTYSPSLITGYAALASTPYDLQKGTWARYAVQLREYTFSVWMNGAKMVEYEFTEDDLLDEGREDVRMRFILFYPTNVTMYLDNIVTAAPDFDVATETGTIYNVLTFDGDAENVPAATKIGDEPKEDEEDTRPTYSIYEEAEAAQGKDRPRTVYVDKDNNPFIYENVLNDETGEYESQLVPFDKSIKILPTTTVNTLAEENGWFFAGGTGAYTIVKLEHNLRFVSPAEPSCTEDGHEGYYECKLCGKLFADSAAKKEISANDVKLPAAHTLGELVPRKDATCTADGHVEYYECRLCGKLFADSAAEREISADDVKVPAAHSLGELVPRKNATCVADGVRAHYRCTECGAYFDAEDTTTPVEYSSLIIPSKDGAHDLRLITAAAPSCTGDGHVEYYECRLCGKLFADSAAEREISADDVKIPAAHSLGELVPRKNATCVADGVRAHYRCTECGAYFDAEDTTTPVEYSSLIIPSKDGAHDLRLVTAAAPLCTGDGHVEYYECRLCGKLFADSAAEREISADDVRFLGDGNRDGKINVKDIVIAIRAAIGQTMDNIDLDALDINRDGNVDVKDIIILIRHSTGYKQSYLIGYQMSSVPSAKPLVKVVSGVEFITYKSSITYKGQKDEYAYTAQNDGLVRIDISELKSGIYVDLYVYDRLGEEVVFRDYCKNNSGVSIPKAKAGDTYRIQVRYNNEFGDYVLTIGQPKPVIDVTSFKEVRDSIQYTEQYNYYTFTPSVDGLYRFDLNNMQSDFYVRLYLYDRLGYEVSAHEYCANNGITGTNLKAGEEYKIAVEYVRGFGDYSLVIGRQNPTVDISGLTEISDRITFKEQKNVYSFTAPSDGDCRFDITEMKSDVHVGLYVYDRLGYEVVSHGYCSNNSGITLNGMKSGETYKIVVVYITGFGDYTLTINH